MVALQTLAERLGLGPAMHRTPEGAPRTIFLVTACLASLALWTAIGWSFGHWVALLVAR